jgi:hypothetical protein
MVGFNLVLVMLATPSGGPMVMAKPAECMYCLDTHNEIGSCAGEIYF